MFAQSTSTFRAEDLGKTSATADQRRQQHFQGQLRRLALTLGSNELPVFVDLRGKRLRLDKGCVGHAVAAGGLERPENNAAGFVQQVRLRDIP